MSDRLAAAQAALNAGRKPEAIDHLIAAVTEDPARAAPVYRVLAGQLYSAGRYTEGEAYAARGLERHPRDYELLNTRGVLLRRLLRYAEAVPVLEQAVKLNPKSAAALQNLGNVLYDMNDAAGAEPVFARLARSDPRNPDTQRMLGRCLLKLGRIEPALVRFRQAVSLKRDNIEGWLDLAGAFNEENRSEEAEQALDKALAQNPGNGRLLEGKVIVMRRSGQAARAEVLLRELLPTNGNAAWLHFQLAAIIADKDREQANVHFARAAELNPSRLEYSVTWLESLERTRTGDEGANIERAYQLARKLLPRKLEFTDSVTKVMSEVFVRVCDFDSVDQLGDLRSMGRAWAENGRHTAFLKQLARVRSDADRLEVLEQHRAWGRKIQAAADRRPIQRPPPRPEGGKIRLGFMSSDLRRHPVGYFAMPLFEHIDRERFEVFVYSYYDGREDPVQRAITERIAGYRWWPDVSVPQAAQRIAEDQLDILVELGGSTHMNKPEVMAYRPAPIQASWLGYPHSLGLEAVDYLICDPWIAPPDRKLLIEKPLILKNAWYPLSAAVFSDSVPLDREPPVSRNGYVTFGTANQPSKFNRECLRAWAQIMARCPDSRFLFIRPEGSSPSFRENLFAAFAAEGIGRSRIEFEAVRGTHLPHYNRVDISLDPFPQTGGTTTCESMWMGAPCVSLVGPAPYERLSYSVLNNVGLGDLCATSVDEFIETAVRLASDPARIAELRAGMRERMRASPLGQTEAWARDFYDAMECAVRGEA
jgi:protein O-GlcNAc transferase